MIATCKRLGMAPSTSPCRTETSVGTRTALKSSLVSVFRMTARLFVRTVCIFVAENTPTLCIASISTAAQNQLSHQAVPALRLRSIQPYHRLEDLLHSPQLFLPDCLHLLRLTHLHLPLLNSLLVSQPHSLRT